MLASQSETKVLGIRMDMADYRALAAIARANEREVSQEARKVLKDYIRTGQGRREAVRSG